MIDLREKKTSKHEEDEIKFVNKGEKFKSEKGDDIEIVDINKGDDKTIVTYKLGSDEKKGDIEDVIKMLNGAEYKKVDDKKDEKKSCKSEDDEDGAEDGVDAGEDDGEQTDEKKAKKEADDEDDKDDSEDDDKKDESANDGSVEITITEEFHVPGTDIVFEAGDVIRIIPKKINEAHMDFTRRVSKITGKHGTLVTIKDNRYPGSDWTIEWDDGTVTTELETNSEWETFNPVDFANRYHYNINDNFIKMLIDKYRKLGRLV